MTDPPIRRSAVPGIRGSRDPGTRDPAIVWADIGFLVRKVADFNHFPHQNVKKLETDNYQKRTQSAESEACAASGDKPVERHDIAVQNVAGRHPKPILGHGCIVLVHTDRGLEVVIGQIGERGQFAVAARIHRTEQ